MKLVTFGSARERRLGVIEGEHVLALDGLLKQLGNGRVARGLAANTRLKQALRIFSKSAAPRDMIELLSRGEPWRRALSVVTSHAAEAFRAGSAPALKGLFVPLKKARLLAPIARPGKICCIGLNYADHAREQGVELPDRPILFLKSVNTIGGPGEPVRLPPTSNQVDYEAELAVVIGKGGSNIPEAKAMEHVAGYVILNDISARDMQFGDKQWARGKSCDTFAPTGPWIVTRDEVPDPHQLKISLTLNGKTMQDSNTSNLIFKIPFLVSYLSQSMTWEVGDILSTGTPPGVGVFRKPPVFLKPGDSMTVSLERIGSLTNTVAG